EGTIIKWLKAEGDEVARGDELVEIETDKATMTYEADTDGVLQIVAAEGDTLPVGEVIARLNGGSGGSGASGDGRQASEGAEPEAAPAPPPEPEPEPEAAAPAPQGNGGERVKASPIARRMAREKGLDLSSLSGTGPGGRIVKADVAGAAAPTPDARRPTPETPTPDTQTGKGSSELVELTRTQQLIARRMAESKATVPDFALDMDIDMAAAVAMRAQLKDVAEVVPSFNDMVVKACALALREYPRANGSYKDGRYELHARVNVGVAVAAQDALIVPTVFDADRKSLG